MLVAGGSGVTYALSTAQEILQKSAEGASRTRVVELVWSITDPGTSLTCTYSPTDANAVLSAGLKPLLPLFTQLLTDSRSTYTTFRISVFYTRALASPEAMKAFERLPLGLTISPGRPRLNKLLEGVADRTAGSGGMDGLTGVVVGVCGPPALGSSVEKTVRGLDRQRRSAVGGVELHEEYVSHLSLTPSLLLMHRVAGFSAGENQAFPGHIQSRWRTAGCSRHPRLATLAHSSSSSATGTPLPASRQLTLASTTVLTSLCNSICSEPVHCIH